jgi:hypothetical protein
MPDSDNLAQEQIWEEIQHRSSKISTVERFKQQYLSLSGDERAEEHRFLWQGEYEKCRNYYGRPIQSVDGAVGRIVFDACWYTNYDRETVADIIQDSPYSVEDCSDSLKQMMIEAFELQEGGCFGGSHSTETKESDDDGDDDDDSSGGNTSQNIKRRRTHPYGDSVGCGDKVDRNLSKL